MKKILVLFGLFCIVPLQTILQTKAPRISIITSVYDGDFYINRFLENTVQLTDFDQYELILINANSPGNEEEIIKEYMKKYPNIKYIRLSYDPGIYGVWNIGVIVAKGKYIINANLDDLRYSDSCKNQADFLDAHPDVGLIFSDFMLTEDPIGNIDTCKIKWRVEVKEISDTKKDISACLPGPFPMWRKEVHSMVGVFDETFLYSGDWEFWCRMAKRGCIFAKAPGITGIYYQNPNGLSTNQVPEKVARRNNENQYIIEQYSSMWRGEE